MLITDYLSKRSVTELLTVVYVLVDDYLKAAENQERFKLPDKTNQKGTYSELFSIVLVGEILQQKNQGLWYTVVKTE